MSEESFKGYHQSREAGASLQPGLRLKTTVFEGDYEELSTYAKALIVGRKANSTSSSSMTGLDSEYYVAGLQLSRTHGKRGRMAVQLAQQQGTEVWGLEMAELQKPIKTWKADAEGDQKPDLNLLSNWEMQASDASRKADYQAYRVNGEDLTGNTLILAKMIREEGIDHYVVYSPVLTCTTRLNALPDDIGKGIGAIATPTSSEDNSAMGTLTNLAKSWLKTTDRIQGAIDGTYTRVQQWTGADKWNANLYGSGSSSSSSSSSSGS